jgi:hypothetical protein
LVMADWVTVVAPRDPWPFSTVTVDDLEALVADGLLRPLSGDPQPDWMAPSSGAAPSPPSGYVLSFVFFHEQGFGVPASRFMRAILHFYEVELHNLNPNSIAQAALFAAVCEGFLGIDPHWDLWTHLFSAEPFALTKRERRVRMAVRAGGCILQLRQARAQQYIPAILVSSNKGWQRRWFYLRNNDGRLPSFSQRVVTAAGSNWRYGTPRDRQKNLQPLLEALQELRDGGLTTAGVVAAIHRRRVLPLTERWLLLSEMTPGVDLEGSQMSSVPLPADDLHRRVAGTVGRLDAGDLTQPSMRPERGCISLMSVRSFFLLCVKLPLVLIAEISVRLQELGFHKPSLPPVPEDAVDRAVRRVAAEKKKEKKDAKKAQARERMQARDALERRRRKQERDGLPREPSPETPDDDDDDDDEDDEDGDMAARLGLSLDLRLGQGSSSQPPSGLAPSVSRAGVSGSRSEEQGQAEGVLDPLAEVVEVTPGSQADPPVPKELLPVPAAQEADPQVAMSAPGRTVPSAPRAPEAGMVPKPAAGQTLVVPAGTEARGASPQARLIMARSG